MQDVQRKVIAAAVVVALVVGFVVLVTRGERSRDLVLSIEPVDGSNDITVYVGGAVAEPGLYSLPRGSRVADAIDLAGILDDSDIDTLNLASALRDEQSVIVPERETETGPTSADIPPTEGAVGRGLININRAGADHLELLPGIGPVLAERIVERRETDGQFQSIDELSEINGISDRMVDELRDMVVIDQ